MINKLLPIIGFIAVLGITFILYQLVTYPISTDSYAGPILITNDPIQINDSISTIAPLQLGKTRFFLTIKAKYKLSGILVSTRRYHDGYWSRLSPYDFAVCWGKVPDMFPYLKFNQIARFCHFRYRHSVIVDKDYVLSHMSNNHIIPANRNIYRALSIAKKKEPIEIEGYLVNAMASVKGRGTSDWNTSIKREDSGAGACEIIYVTKLRLNDKVYE